MHIDALLIKTVKENYFVLDSLFFFIQNNLYFIFSIIPGFAFFILNGPFYSVRYIELNVPV